MAKRHESLVGTKSGSLTISKVCKQFHISRSALLYYDSIGLLSPRMRTNSGYRLYSAEDVQRLQRILELRATGLALEHIKTVIDSALPMTAILEQQLLQLQIELQQCQERRHILLALLGESARQLPMAGLSKEAWTDMFRAIGMSDDDMHQWHAEFEQRSAIAHENFLASLSLSMEEIMRIRAWSRAHKSFRKSADAS